MCAFKSTHFLCSYLPQRRRWKAKVTSELVERRRLCTRVVFTSSAAVAQTSRNVLCPSVGLVSFNNVMPRAESFIIVSDLPLRTIKCCSVVFGHQSAMVRRSWVYCIWRSMRSQHAMEPYIGWDSDFCLPHLHWTPQLWGPRRIIAMTFGTAKLEWCGDPRWWKFFEDMFIRFDRMYERDKRTDRQADTAWRYRPRLHSIARQKVKKAEAVASTIRAMRKTKIGRSLVEVNLLRCRPTHNSVDKHFFVSSYKSKFE